MKTKGIIFDFDGTLSNALPQTIESFHQAIQGAGEGPFTTMQIKEYFGRGADRIFQKLLKNEKKAALAFRLFVENQTKLAPHLPLHKGIPELLEKISKEAIPMGIVTGRHFEDLSALMKPHKLEKYFSTLIADNHLKKSKPDPEGILLAAKNLGVLPNEIVYIGDSATDVQAAHRAGGKAIAVFWDSHANRQELLAEEPDFVAETPQEVWQFISNGYNQ